jgi:hypothetical protein
MAYPSVSGPYGLIPINLIGGQVFASATRLIPIATNSSTAIFFGDVVKLASTGTLAKDVGTDTATPVGVFLGCSYTDPTFGKTFRQSYAATTDITDIVAYVQDDPDALFKVAVVSATTTIGYVTRANVGENAVLVQNAGSTITGNSKVAIDDGTALRLRSPSVLLMSSLKPSQRRVPIRKSSLSGTRQPATLLAGISICSPPASEE